MSDSSRNLHENHRARVRKRFEHEGLKTFADHNVLELLLFYSIPQKDTNDIAHRLLDEFGSLSAVFDAPKDVLMNVVGVGENTATLIKLFGISPDEPRHKIFTGSLGRIKNNTFVFDFILLITRKQFRHKLN